MRDQARINYLGAQRAESVLRPACRRRRSRRCRAQNIVRERLLRPYPQFDAVNTTTNEGWSWYHALQLNLQRRFCGGYTHVVELHLLEVHRGDRVPQRRRSGAVGRHLERGHAAPADASNGICELPFGRGRRYGGERAGVVGGADRRLAVLGDLHLPERLPARRRATSSSPATSTTSSCRPASARSRAGSTPTPASTRSTASSSASNVRTFPLRLENVRADAVNNVDLSLIKNTSIARQDARAAVRLAQRVQSPAARGAGQQSDGEQLRADHAVRRRRTTRAGRRSR